MPKNLNRSPCNFQPSTFRLLESAHPRADPGASLREIRAPDRAHVSVREETRNGKTVTLVDVTVATAGKINRNGRLYTREVWQAAITAAQEDMQAGKLWALLEHPEDSWDRWDPLKGRLENICIRYESLTLDGNAVKATGLLIETVAGQDLKALLGGGIAVGVSSNGTGSVRYIPAKEVAPDHPDPEAYIGVIQDDFRLLTIDMVSDPSDTSGQARQRAAARRQKENTMHPKIRALMEKHGVSTLEELKTKAMSEYVAAMESIVSEATQAPSPAPTPAPAPAPSPAPAPTPAPAPAPSPAPAPTTNAESTLERNVLALNARLEASERQAFSEKRTNIAITALEAAQLPRAPKVGDLDLDARFREQVIQVAISAQSEDEARQLVDQMIQERRVLMGAASQPQRGRTQESAGQRAGGVSLPSGNNSAPARQLEGHNPVASVRSSLGLR